MYYEIEKSGCCERKGLLQIRMDIHQEDNFTDVKIYPEKGYDGKLNEQGTPVDMEYYQKWFDNLPTEKKNLPIHTHFFYLDHDATDEDIKAYAEKMCQKYNDGEEMKNDEIIWKPENKSLCEARLVSVKMKDFTTVKLK